MRYSEHERELPLPLQNEAILPVTDTLHSNSDMKAQKSGLAWKIRHWFQVNSFSPGFLTRPWSHPAFGYLAACLLQAMAVTAIVLILQVSPTFRFPEALMLLVVLVVSLFWGAGPGIVTIAVGALLLIALLIPPYFSLSLNSAEDVYGVVLFLVVGLTISLIASQVERTRAEAVMQRRQVERLFAQLEVEQRTLRVSEQETRTRVSELEAIFEALTNGIALFNADGHAVHMNTALRELLANVIQPDSTDSGISAEERLERLKLTDEQGQLLTAETSPIKRVLRGEVLRGLGAPIISMRTLNGQDRLLIVGGAPIHDASGAFTGAVVIVHDVTERRRADRRTQESLNALLVLAEELVQFPEDGTKSTGQAESVPTPNAVAQRLVELISSVLACKRVSITTFDPVTHAHRSAAVVGLPPELEQQWRERRPGFMLSEQLSSPFIDAQLRNDEVTVLDLSQPPLNQRPNPFGIHTMLLAPMTVQMRLVGVLVLDHGEKEWKYAPNEVALAKAVAKLAALVIERERLLTERAESQARELALRDANHLMDEFIAIAGHEIRTPLTTIKGSVQLAKRQLNKVMKRDAALPDDVKSLIASVQDLIDRAERQIGMQNRLVSDLLDVARIRANRLELHPELCDLTVIVRETVEDQQYLVPKRTLHCDIQASGELLVMADADRLRQVIGNYLSNALKYSAAQQAVMVSLRHDRTTVRVQVRDNGPGLPLAEQQRIWERFYRVEGIETKTGSGVGLGLGLHICRMIIERQGGQVGVESSPGDGATFWFTLPMVEAIDG
ncbi:MAG: ATP-binding protein [Ktedonobacteraceae bacterium]